MKKILLLTLLVFAGFSYGQTKENVDQRLVENHGQEIYEILIYRKDYYKFLLWELDNAYEIVTTSSIPNPVLLSISSIEDSNGNSFDSSIIDNPESFNFLKYNFVRQKEQDVFYDLGDGRAIKFTGLKVMWQQFDATGQNTKQ